MTMICNNCGLTGIRWVDRPSNFTHTECPHCGGRDCQRPPAPPKCEFCDEPALPDGDLCEACQASSDANLEGKDQP